MSNPERNLLAKALVEDVLDYSKTIYLVEEFNSSESTSYGERYCCTTEDKAMALIKKLAISKFEKYYGEFATLDSISIDGELINNFTIYGVTIDETYFTICWYRLTKITVDADEKK